MNSQLWLFLTRLQSCKQCVTARLAMNAVSKFLLATCVFLVMLYLVLFKGQNSFLTHNTEAVVCPQEKSGISVASIEQLSSDTIEKDRTKPISIPVIPVHANDYNVNRPTYNLNQSIIQTDWFTAASFLELDFRKRPQEYRCRNSTHMGNWYVCLDGKFLPEYPCLVYSFGIGNDFSFDDDMAEQGCEVHSFDPSMGVKDYIRNSTVHFHAIGLGGKVIENFNARKDMYVREKQTWTIMTLGSIMAALGHKDRDIDVLKIDVEGHEWAVIEYLLQSGLLPRIKQFSLEYHLFPDWPAKSEYPKLLNIYRQLSQSGFKKFWLGLHPLDHKPESFNIQADVGYVNMRYKPQGR
ncbi:probable methyltransferase-like protein 24 [Ylistrum balloti]|uniref:probable methyltransferase-like protein 24 n=1 Tax=Ylistrum balloti TaxID=509963 RepID=UPI002905E44D|nr:probable methyltransferase-like protein 24 [Ylistrum balloti]